VENTPTIRIRAIRVYRDIEERFLNWLFEAYLPLYVAIPGIEEVDWYQRVKENPQYNKTLMISHYPNRKAQVELRNDQRWKDVQKDWAASWSKGYETYWFPAYEQTAIFKKEMKEPLDPEKSPIIHLEGYVLSDPEQDI
jgi:hypothetical protein